MVENGNGSLVYDKVDGDNFGNFFGANDVLYLKDINFDIPSILSKYNSLSYTLNGSSVFAYYENSFNILEGVSKTDEYNTKVYYLDNYIAVPGFSGTHIFETKSEKCAGLLIGAQNIGNQTTKDSIRFFPYSETSREGILDMHRRAVESLKSC